MDLTIILREIVPEMIELLENRYDILKNILYNEPIGRRSLSNNLNMTERYIRSEINYLKDNDFINISSAGMSITEKGKEIILSLNNIIDDIKGLNRLEKEIEDLLTIKRVIIIPGDLDDDELILRDIGKKASDYILSILKDEDIIGITGGSTMYSVANEMIEKNLKKNILITPARGGLGEDLETQSNSIAAQMAQKIGARYKLLHVPDNLDINSLKTITHIPVVKEVIDTIEAMDILIFGIGRADDMAERRNLSIEKINELKKNGAVSEAFGHYFDIKGKEVWESPTIGMSIDTYTRVPEIIAVAGGSKKSEAIISISSLREDITLITDEGAAKGILKKYNK